MSGGGLTLYQTPAAFACHFAQDEIEQQAKRPCHEGEKQAGN